MAVSKWANKLNNHLNNHLRENIVLLPGWIQQCRAFFLHLGKNLRGFVVLSHWNFGCLLAASLTQRLDLVKMGWVWEDFFLIVPLCLIIGINEKHNIKRTLLYIKGNKPTNQPTNNNKKSHYLKSQVRKHSLKYIFPFHSVLSQYMEALLAIYFGHPPRHYGYLLPFLWNESLLFLFQLLLEHLQKREYSQKPSGKNLLRICSTLLICTTYLFPFSLLP